MYFMPFNILGMWFRGLLSIAILAGGIYLLIGGTTTLTSSSEPRSRLRRTRSVQTISLQAR